MRDLFLVGIILLGLIPTLRYPYAGILLWTWFTCMDPHHEAFGFSQTAPLNLIIAIVTIAAWLFSKERKIPRYDGATAFVLLFLVWMTINGFAAFDPKWSWPLWDRTWKTIALGLLISVLATNQIRVHALIWAVVLSLFYYGIKGGLFTILTGGHSHVLGAENSMIADNNQLALALLMVLPLANYLRLHSTNRTVSLGLIAGMMLTLVAILGTYSRGAFVALAALSVVAWSRSKNKLIYPIAAAIVLIPAFLLMPQAYVDRLNTIGENDPSGSLQGRLMAWQVAWHYAVEHFPFGNGFAGSQLAPIFNNYFPHEVTHAAHSIYFEVLGDNGFPGLAIYLGILVLTFLHCSQIRRLSRGIAELSWAFDLTGMIQLSLFAFCLGGALLSMAYYDVFFILVGLTSAMHFIVRDAVGLRASANGSQFVSDPTIATHAAQT